MRERRLSDIARALGAQVHGEDVTVTGIAVDSREVVPGDLFVALPGSRVDGDRFVGQATAAGAVGVLGRELRANTPGIVVQDPGAALAELARIHRRGLDARVVGVTGSVGKTSVKDLIAAVLSPRRAVVASPRSFNTEVGLPLTLLAADESTEVIVCEMGSRGVGHVALLCEIARPEIGVVTSVGAAHLEMFGSLGSVADAKAELVEALPDTGVAVLNADDPVVRGFTERTAARAMTYGFAADADVRGEDLALDPRGMPRFTLVAQGASEPVELALPGEHMASNALAACAVGLALGLEAGECAAALKAARLSPWRMETLETARGIRIINDAYNANPMSTAAALKASRWIAGDGRCIAVLGEMAELGASSAEYHEQIGELAARLGIDMLIVVGEGARPLAAAAVREGVEPKRVEVVADAREALRSVRQAAHPGDTVLLKASRVVGLERVADGLREDRE